ncbi:hypothetical protein TL5118_00968 [Thalassovita autumnalis]|uniref:Phage integrase family protein n=2 Tax=Thalassovita autumnalis TaxID=2072972 RepID=A0A0P1FU48_9RHOB|nr:hypothetical protein TL5118_00968 [Thalassovita autumnalis]CUH70236.1 hypothetical protein TL5120_00007 [Thalassovita autumnalis]
MPRSRRIPHLEYRRSGYVWRRRWPKSLSERWSDSEPSESAIEPNPLVFKSSRRESGPIGENPYSKLAFREAAIENPSKSGAASSRSNGGIPSLVFSLKTHAFSEAQELSIRLTALSNLTFHYIASTMTLTPAVVTHVLTTLVRFEIEAADRIRIQGDQRTPEAAEFALRRERALQETLRQALQLRNHEVARRPLQAVSQHLGIALPEDGDDWKSLAYEATRVLLDVSEERERRERGLFHEPSPYFSQGIGQTVQGIAPSAAVSVGIGQPALAMQVFANGQSPEFPGGDPVLPIAQTVSVSPKNFVVPEQVGSPAQSANSVMDGGVQSTSSDNQPLETHFASKRVLLKNCSEKTVAALNKGENITIDEAFDVYIELKLQGYGEEWDKLQKPDEKTGKKWKNSTEPAMLVAKNIWTDLLEHSPVGALSEETVLEQIPIIRELPTLHGKQADLTADEGYRALVKHANTKERIAMDRVERDLERKGVTDPVEIEMAKLKELIARIRGQTLFKHVRAANRIGKMLLSFGVISSNPFVGCTFTNKEEKRICATEEKIARQRWDDRKALLFQTPVFQGQTRNDADPLFWVPIMGFLQGVRSEEALQLGPKDFGSQNGISYMKIRNSEGNNVKSEAGERVLPIHPALIELGLMELVAQKDGEKRKRLFSGIKRGQTKNTYTELFTKEFTRYRQAHGVYWHGLDLHATRTTFHHDLMDLATPGYIRRALMGHEPLDEGERSYAQNGISLKTLCDCVSAVPFDPSLIISPVRDNPQSKTRIKAQKLGLRAI